jgi:hypothetical protein
MELEANHRTETDNMTNEGGTQFSIAISWQAKHKLHLTIRDTEHAQLTFEGDAISVTAQEVTINRARAGGESYCTWIAQIDATGMFATPPMAQLANNFADGGFVLKIGWRAESWKIQGKSYGSMKGCAERWGTELAKIQMDVLDFMSGDIDQVSFRPVVYGSDLISGRILLPGWVAITPLKGGKAERTVKKGLWCVYREGSKEWRKWMKGQKKK